MLRHKSTDKYTLLSRTWSGLEPFRVFDIGLQMLLTIGRNTWRVRAVSEITISASNRRENDHAR